MTNFPQTFITFSRQRMITHGAEIRAWAKSENPLLAQLCCEVIEASTLEAEK